MSNQLKYYFDFLSQPSRALYIILKQGGRAFEACEINLMEGENLSDEYKANVNRFQKVPAIIDGNFKLAESIAILRYLTYKQYVPARFYPMDLKLRARVDEFLSWQHLAVRSSCSLYFRFTWVQVKVTGLPASAGKVQKYKREMERDLQIIEDIWLKDSPFLTGDSLNAADVFGACEVEQIRITGYTVSEKFPKVARWIERVRQEMNPYFDFAHRAVYQYERETRENLLPILIIDDFISCKNNNNYKCV